jgi:hypothetical protein
MSTIGVPSTLFFFLAVFLLAHLNFDNQIAQLWLRNKRSTKLNLRKRTYGKSNTFSTQVNTAKHENKMMSAPKASIVTKT